MRKRIASLFLVLALCLSLLPTAALAEEMQDTTPGDTIPASESAQEPEVDETVEDVRSAIDALPSAEDWADLTAEEQKAAAEDASMAYEAYEELTEEQQAALSDELGKLIALFGKINSEVAPLALSGSGTEDSPYEVSSAEDWAAVCEKANYGNLKVHVKLTDNIDLSATSFTSVTLYASLNGDGHTISGLTKPLFNGLNGAAVKNLAIVGANITGSSGQNVGILANTTSSSATIQNCYVSGTVSGSSNGVGGFIGNVQSTTTFTNCAADVTITNNRTSSRSGAGGFVGCVSGQNLVTISYCYTTGTVISKARGAGGFVGAALISVTPITVNHSVALQSEVSNDTASNTEGRLVGDANFSITDSAFNYAYADMKGAKQTNEKYDPTVGRNGADVSKAACTTADFWKDTVSFDTSVWNIEDGILPRLKNISAMTGTPPTYLLDAASCPVTLNEGAEISVSFETTDADTVTKTGTVTITYTGSDALSAGDFQLFSSESAPVSIAGLRITALNDNTLTIEMAKSVTNDKAYLFYKSYCLGEITLSKTVNKVILPAPTNAKWDATVLGKATWSSVDNAANYRVQLYKDGTPQDKAVTAVENSYDFTPVIAYTGSYTFKVKALGDDTYSDSAEATSGAYTFTQQTLADVKTSAVAALAAMSVSNDTTADEVLKVITDRITNKQITAAWSDGESGFKLTPASNGVDPSTNGHITGKIVLTLDGTQETITVNLTIQPKFAVTFASSNTSAVGTAPTQENVTADTEITLPANPYTYYGKKFTGWSDGKSTYQPNDTYTMSAGNVTFTALWTDDIWDGSEKSASLNGSGTADDPYIIASGADLNYLANMGTAYCSKYYKVMADIDMGNYEMPPIYRLTGTFDGNGHKITNLKIAGSGVYYGLFKEAGNSGTAAVIKNLTLENAVINDTHTSDSGKLGLLVSYTSDKLTIEGCYVTGSITTTSKPYMNVGGLVGQVKGADVTISRCYAGVTFIGGDSNSTFGGLVGSCEGGTIENCYAIPDMSGVTAGYRSGITSGSNNNPVKIINCYAAGASLNGAGIARNTATVSSSVSIFPEMRGSARIFVNNNNVSGSNNYGFDGTIQRDSSGIVTPPAEQFAADQAQGADATATQLKSFSFYKDTLGWSEDIWEIRSGYDFPVLKGQKAVPTLTLDLAPSVVSVTLDKDNATLPCASTLQLTATVDVKNGGSQTVQWHSSNLSMAVVDGNGKVTIPANAASGEVKITATATADASKIAVCTINADANSYKLTGTKDPTNTSNSPNAVCTFYASAEDAQNETNPIDIETTTVKAGTTVFARITNMTDEDVANHVLVNDKEATRLNGSTFSFTMPCENATAVFSCAVNLNAYNYVWFVGIDWGTWGETVTYTTTEWSGSDHIGSLQINGIINGKLFDSFDLKSMTGYDRTTKEENRVSLTKKNSKTDLTVPGDYFVDTTDTAHPVLYVYNDKPGTIMVNISLKDDQNATYNITKEAASTDYYTLDKTRAKAGDTVTATLTDAGIKAIGTNQSMTLDYYGGLLIVMFPGQFQKNDKDEWTASFKMPAQDITTRVYVSSRLKVTLTGEDKTVEYNGQPQTIDSAIKAKLGDVEASEAMWGHYDVTYTNGSTTSKTAPTDAGTYTCIVKIADSDTLYYSNEITVTLTIKKATLTKVPAAPQKQSVTKHSITLNRPTTFADGSAMSDSYTLEYKCGENGTWQDSLTFTGLDAATPYTFYVRIKESKNTNASGSSTGTDITTADKDNVTFTLPEANQTFTYDKTGKTPGMATASAGGIQLEVQYTGTDGTAYNSTEAPVKAGSYQVIYKVPNNNPDYRGTSAAVAFTIGKRTITVKADDKSMTVGGTLPEFTVSYGNLASGDSAETVFTTLATATTTADGKTTGSFEITVTTPTLTAEASNNYEVAAPEKGTLTVSQRSSSGGGSTTYPVNTPNETENGTVTVSPKNASKGSTVTITVKPDSGYQLDDLTVTDKNGKELKLTDKGNGKYTFTMPASKVEIKATFVKEVETSPFSDVSTSAYYYEAVKWAQEKGITGGIGNGLFGPNQPCTRAQIVTFLWRAAGSPEPKAMSSFADVSTDAYYAKAVAWAVENGITTGTGDGKFSPDATCTRAQSVTFLFRAIGKLVDSKAEFSDVLTDSYYANAVAWAVENGVTNGIGDGLFGPDNSCTRAQIVTFLFRAYQGK